jgi:hypothetical protein
LRAEAALSGPCQWIAGEPSEDDACKCGAPALEGRPYCGRHHARAYVLLAPELRSVLRRVVVAAPWIRLARA